MKDTITMTNLSENTAIRFIVHNDKRQNIEELTREVNKPKYEVISQHGFDNLKDEGQRFAIYKHNNCKDPMYLIHIKQLNEF